MVGIGIIKCASDWKYILLRAYDGQYTSVRYNFKMDIYTMFWPLIHVHCDHITNSMHNDITAFLLWLAFTTVVKLISFRK